MADYVALSDLSGLIPGAFAAEALDDDGDGVADTGVWTQIAADVARFIDGVLGGRFAVPFTAPLPAIVVSAAKVLACEQLYIRRGRKAEDNPFASQASAVRKQLASIAIGKEALSPSAERARASVSIVSEPAKTFSANGRSAV